MCSQVRILSQFWIRRYEEDCLIRLVEATPYDESTFHWFARIAAVENGMTVAEHLSEESLLAPWKMIEKDADHQEIVNVLLVRARVALVKGTLDERDKTCCESMGMLKRICSTECD